jgi:hypothetical protein
MDRKTWKQRLIDAEIPEEVVDDLLATVKDEDLVRMKDMSTEEILTAMKDALVEDDTAEEDTETAEEQETTTEEDTAEDEDESTLAADLSTFRDELLTKIKEQMEALEIEVEAPQIKTLSDRVEALEEQISGISAMMKDLSTSWAEVLRGDAERLKDMLDNMSPAQRVRLRATLTDQRTADRVNKWKEDRDKAEHKDARQDSDFRQLGRLPTGPVTIRDAAGNEYESLAAMARGAGASE